MTHLILALSLLAAAPAHDHDHDHAHDHAMEENIADLTREQVVAPVHTAREIYKQAKLDALNALKDKVAADLKPLVDEDIADVAADRFVMTYAGETEPFAMHGEAQQAFITDLETAHDTYYAALQHALRRDRHGYIGDLMMDELETTIDTDLMWQLMDYYWHRGDLDTPPASFNRTILMSYRFVELEPESPTIYANAAWLLWSRWVSWKKNPEKRELGEGDDAKALAFLQRGRKALPEHSPYHYDAGMTLWGLARYHDPKYWDFIIESFILADKHATTQRDTIRARLMLGHAYRQTDQLEKAKQAYQRVLEADPEHEIAKRLITEVEAE